MISALDARKIAIENRLTEEEMANLNNILFRIGTVAVNGEDILEWEDFRLLPENTEWALKKLGYKYECVDSLTYYRYTISW